MAIALDFEGSSGLDAHAEALESLLLHVHDGVKVVSRVALGFALSNGRVKNPPAWAYRVYVEWDPLAADPAKRAKDALASIPSMVGQIQVDAFIAMPPERACQSEISSGMKMTIYPHGETKDLEYGTIGLFVQQGSAPYIVTAGHVLQTPSGGKGKIVDVYVPERDSSSAARPIAAISDPDKAKNDVLGNMQQRIGVDADIAMAKLEEGIEYSPHPDEPGGPITGNLRDLIKEQHGSPPAAPIEVWKYGARTGLTRGEVVELLYVTRNVETDATFTHWLAKIQAIGEPRELRLYVSKQWDTAAIAELDARIANRGMEIVRDGQTATANIITINAGVFSWQGDSGAAVYDLAGNLIGLVSGGEGFRFAEAGESDGERGLFAVMIEPSGVTYITQGFTKLGLSSGSIVTTSAVAAGVTAGGQIATKRPVQPQLEALLARSPAGQVLWSLVRRHRTELVELVHHHRAVTVAWHRGKGAGFMAAVLSVLDGTRATLPVEIDGVAAGAALRTVFGALHANASPDLRRDLDTHAQWIAETGDRVTSVDELLERLARRALVT